MAIPARPAPEQPFPRQRPRAPEAPPPSRSFADVTMDIARSLGTPGRAYFAWMSVLSIVLTAGIIAWTSQIWEGLGMAGLRTPEYWALYITAFVFWIGLGHAGTLISAILYLFRARWRTSIYRAAEAMTVFAVMTANTVIASAAR